MWKSAADYEDVRYEKSEDGAIAKITINRPEVRNAFRPLTVKELLQAFELAHQDRGSWSHYPYRGRGEGLLFGRRSKSTGARRLSRRRRSSATQCSRSPKKKSEAFRKPVVAMVAGYAIGGGHVLHIVCDLTIAADNARFGQTGPKVGSFDGDWVRVIWPGLSVKKRRVKFGISADNTMPNRHSTWAWSILWFLLPTWKQKP